MQLNNFDSTFHDPRPTGSMMQTCNIAIIAGQLVVGGAERQLYLWLSNLDRNRFRPVVLTLHPGQHDYWESYIELLNIPLFRIPHRRSRLMRMLDIVRTLRPYRPQLIHGWHLFASPYAGVSAKLLGVKSLGSLRGAYGALSNTPLVTALTFHSVDSILANSMSVAKQVQYRNTYKRKEQKIYSVQNAVEVREIGDRVEIRRILAQRFDLSPTSIWIGSLGRLDPMKRFDLLLRLIALLLEDERDFHCLLIGDGPERIRLGKLAAELGITQHVVFAGEVPDASGWLCALDIFCFTSLEEGLPNAVMEAAAAAVPIVSWRIPFMEELLNNTDEASLVEPENLPALKEAVLHLIHFPELRMKMGRDARNHMLRSFTTGHFVQKMTDIYDDLLGIQKPSGETGL